LDSLSKSKVFSYEVVVVDDGSQDDTFLRAYRYSQKNGHVKVIRFPINAGKGYAIKTGFVKASGEIIVFVDSDLEIDLKTISRYVDALKNADIVIATKWHNESEVSMSLGRKLLSRTFNVLARLLIGFDLKDTQVGLKVMRRSSVASIFPRLAVKRYAFDVELLAVSHLYNLRIVEMPVKINLDAPFKPKEAWRMFVDLLGIAYRLRIIRWYQRQSVSGIL
jgi:glycosyltransferase involved in cell wall biosynthesis